MPFQGNDDGIDAALRSQTVKLEVTVRIGCHLCDLATGLVKEPCRCPCRALVKTVLPDGQ